MCGVITGHNTVLLLRWAAFRLGVKVFPEYAVVCIGDGINLESLVKRNTKALHFYEVNCRRPVDNN